MIVLKKRAEFLALRRGKKQVTPGFILQALPRSGGAIRGKKAVADEKALVKREPELPPRFGFTVSKKVGNAVQRNRVRRRLRELIREVAEGYARPETDYNLIGRRAALQRPYAVMREDMIRAFQRLHSSSRPRLRQGKGKRAKNAE